MDSPRKQSPGTATQPDLQSKLAPIEKLPAEVIQDIFQMSCNGNLFLASPTIGAQLSHGEAIYRATFVTAFYPHQLNGMAGVLGLRRPLDFLTLPIRPWDMRSMTQAILRSRWCTCEWVKNFLFTLLELV